MTKYFLYIKANILQLVKKKLRCRQKKQEIIRGAYKCLFVVDIKGIIRYNQL